jgi:hypothetical protein
MELFMKDIYATWQSKTYRDYLKRFGLPQDKQIKAYSTIAAKRQQSRK